MLRYTAAEKLEAHLYQKRKEPFVYNSGSDHSLLMMKYILPTREKIPSKKLTVYEKFKNVTMIQNVQQFLRNDSHSLFKTG